MSVIFNVPTREEIAGIQIGDQALDCFGRLNEVTEITARREDIKGKLFICYYTRFGPKSQMSMSQKEGYLTRTVATSREHISVELDRIESEIVAGG